MGPRCSSACAIAHMNVKGQRTTLAQSVLASLTAPCQALVTMELTHGEYRIDDALDRFDFAACHAWLSASYWSPGISRAEVERGFKNSTLVLGAYSENAQVGCLRVISDRTRFAYFMDVFVDERHRGRGLGRALVKSALEHPDLKLVYKWTLATADAHGVYGGVGFSPLREPERWMSFERPRPWLSE